MKRPPKTSGSKKKSSVTVAAAKARALVTQRRDSEASMNIDLKTFTPEALEWMESNTSLPGAWAPFYYVGRKIPQTYAKALGRPLTLDEVQCFAELDGDVLVCRFTHKEFQPVKWISRAQRGLEERFARGETIADMKAGFPTDGCFFIDHETKMVMAFSGTPLELCKRTGHFQAARPVISPLVMAAQRRHKLTGQWIDGAPRQRMQDILDQQAAASEQFARMDEIMEKSLGRRPDHHARNNEEESGQRGKRLRLNSWDRRHRNNGVPKEE